MLQTEDLTLGCIMPMTKNKIYIKPKSIVFCIEQEKVIATSGDSIDISEDEEDEDGRYSPSYRTNIWV